MNKINKNFTEYLLPICLILIMSFSRLVPHPWNFTPVLAIGIFSGFYFKNFIFGSFIVICSMFVVDLYLGLHSTMFFTYISLVIAVALGLFINKFGFKEILFTGLTGSVCFFVITNFGSWLTLEMYEKNLTGLFQSYVLAIPFFHNTLISTLLYLFVLKLLLNFSFKKEIV